MATRESHGPDPCNKNLKCQDFHDELGQRAGTGSGSAAFEELGGCYNCCCCDPCRFVRPEVLTAEEDERMYCCRCVPRGFFLRFVPDNPDDECCRQVGIPIFNQPGEAGEYITLYQGTLFGVDVEVEVGRVISSGSGSGSGTGVDFTCGWRITSSVGGSGSGSGGVDTFVIDHDTTTCLYVPTGITLGAVEGPDGCMGTLVLDDLDKARLPFLERDVTANWTGPNFVDISSEPCGDCEQVCEKICVAGIRHVGDTREHVEFTWFDDSGSGSGSVGDLNRGWRYTDPDSNVETIYLTTNDSGDCLLTPDLESGAEIFDPVTISATTLCSCKLAETFSTTVGEIAYAFTVRCGFCSCWDFACGNCRCVPSELCVLMYDGTTMYANLTAIWNADNRSWDVEGGGSGSGSGGTELLQLHLRGNAAGQCIIVPEINGVEVTLDNPPVWGCGAETVTGQFTGEHDLLSIDIQEEVDLGAGPVFLMLRATSLTPECGLTDCEEATPCYANCGSHPPKLTINVHEWALEGDTSGDPTDCSVDIDVYYWQSVDDIIDGGIKYSCGYVGVGPTCYGCLVKAELRNGQVFFDTVPFGCTPAIAVERDLVTETCHPYSGDTGELVGAGYVTFGTCIGCSTEAYRQRITVAESP